MWRESSSEKPAVSIDLAELLLSLAGLLVSLLYVADNTKRKHVVQIVVLTVTITTFASREDLITSGHCTPIHLTWMQFLNVFLQYEVVLVLCVPSVRGCLGTPGYTHDR